VQRLIYAFRFIQACFSLALNNSRLRKHGLYLWLGGISLLVIGLLPLGLVVALLGLRPLGMTLIGLLSVLLLLSLLVWGELVALETCQVFNHLTRPQESQSEVSSERRKFSHWGDIGLWVVMLPGLNIIYIFDQIFRPSKAINHKWLEVSYLILPVISLEDSRLALAVERIKQMMNNRLIRFHPDLVAIRPLAGVVQWLLILGGGFLGYRVGVTLADPITTTTLSQLFAFMVGLLLAGFLAIIGIGFSSFNRACYYTSLYQWAVNVETARFSGESMRSVAPAILGRVMSKTNPSKKDS